MTIKSKYPPVEPDQKYGELVSNFFWHKLDHFASRTLFIDFETGRKWTGATIKATSARIAINLIKYGLAPHTNCVLFYKHNDYIQLAALGILFAGASVCVGYDSDPEHEHAHMLQLLKPSFVFVRHELVAEAVRHCKSIGDLKPCALVVMDDDEMPGDTFSSLISSAGQHQHHLRELGQHSPGTRILGLHSHLMATTAAAAASSITESNVKRTTQLPVQIDPNWPAFILLTSGSTGRPKPAGRSQRNSLYVAHSLQGDANRELWPLDESSVLLGHLALDHGTGIFQLKQNIALGLTCVLMNGYDLSRTLAAIEKYQITDICLGSALVHKFLSAPEVDHLLSSPPPPLPTSAQRDCAPTSCLGSLRNLLAVGSPIASASVVRKFMSRVPSCSVRQAFGMTECGFLTIVPRALATAASYPDDSRIVGVALPNVEFKLLALTTDPSPNPDPDPDPDANRDGKAPQTQVARQEIQSAEQAGELYVRGPTISPGYHGPEHAEQSRLVFGPDGFYKSGDICSLARDGMLRVHGRQSEVLCLYDGWKVLPAEIEQVLLEHPLVGEAAVIGVPHPDLRTCHAARAYIVPRGESVAVASDDDELAVAKVDGLSGVESPRADQRGKFGEGARDANGAREHKIMLTKEAIFDFVAGRLSEPKHLVGGIRFMRELPKISIGKVDKKSLMRLDGLLA